MGSTFIFFCPLLLLCILGLVQKLPILGNVMAALKGEYRLSADGKWANLYGARKLVSALNKYVQFS